jgi:alpha-D-xyloside xylohydrolase
MGEFRIVFQNEPVDVSEEFSRQENHFFVGEKVEEFDLQSASGRIRWKSFSPKQRVSYHQITTQLEEYRIWEDLPQGEYEDDRTLPFDLSFVTPRTVRLRLAARPEGCRGEPTLMLVDEPPTDDSWEVNDRESSTAYLGPCGSVVVDKDPLRFEFRDAAGGLLTGTHNLSDTTGVINARPTPLSFVRNTATFYRHIATSFRLSPGEKLFGGGESFTRLDKRGQKLVLWTYDAYSAQTPDMYKPIPFL